MSDATMRVTVTHTNDDGNRSTDTYTGVELVRAALGADAVKVYFTGSRPMLVLHDATIVNVEIDGQFDAPGDTDDAVVDAMREVGVSI
jgi:hypothetical protein